MNTRQKLTIGLAAIFMVTLTIVGVTYAYFVTRVKGNETPIDVSTAQLGSVVYVKGNEYKAEGEAIEDQITLTGVEPGLTVYKTFSVKNNGEVGVDPSKYAITVATQAGNVKFVHSATGSDGDTDVEANCYPGSPNEETLGNNAAYVQPSINYDTYITEATYTNTCLVEDGKYNNIAITLYDVTKEIQAEFADDALAATADVSKLTGKEYPMDVTKLGYNTTDTIVNSREIVAGGANVDVDAPTVENSVHYYVLKVQYVDNGMNQNVENLAELDLTVSIKAA